MKNTTSSNYTLVDSGQGRKLERFGPYLLSRPSAQAVWEKRLPDSSWKEADAFFTREEDKKWSFRTKVPDHWTVTVSGIVFKLSVTDFGHLGIFPEQKESWAWIQETIEKARKQGRKEIKVLNLFAYSGGSTLAAAKAGASVCHLDASKGMVAWARENAALNGLEGAPIRWIVDDVQKFLQRESRRGNRYDAIILDPPTFGRGSQGELFKIEEHLHPILKACKDLLSSDPIFFLLSCHTPGYTPIAMCNIMDQLLGSIKGKIETGEMVLSGSPETFLLPSGTFARWTNESLLS